MKKKYTKRNTTFLNTPSSGCMAGVMWRVQFTPPKVIKKNEKEEGWYSEDELLKPNRVKARMSASIILNEDAKEHYVHSKGNLRALRNMRKELDAFEEACMQALQDVEDSNAEID